MAIVTCIVKRSPLSIVMSHDICRLSVVLEKDLHAVLTSFLASHVERGALKFVSRLDISLIKKQSLQNQRMVVQCCKVKGCLELV